VRRCLLNDLSRISSTPPRVRTYLKASQRFMTIVLPDGWQRQAVANAMNRVWGPRAQPGDGGIEPAQDHRQGLRP
ncbi:MAG: hypothetical protein MUC88_28020, partial [Planctomycetes bacterium]|nr:hypothetical protein [Planctomycetota bacterium]